MAKKQVQQMVTLKVRVNAKTYPLPVPINLRRLIPKGRLTSSKTIYLKPNESFIANVQVTDWLKKVVPSWFI